MYVVECAFGCGTFVQAKGAKPQYRWCGRTYCDKPEVTVEDWSDGKKKLNVGR